MCTSLGASKVMVARKVVRSGTWCSSMQNIIEKTIIYLSMNCFKIYPLICRRSTVSSSRVFPIPFSIKSIRSKMILSKCRSKPYRKSKCIFARSMMFHHKILNRSLFPINSVNGLFLMPTKLFECFHTLIDGLFFGQRIDICQNKLEQMIFLAVFRIFFHQLS